MQDRKKIVNEEPNETNPSFYIVSNVKGLVWWTEQ